MSELARADRALPGGTGARRARRRTPCEAYAARPARSFSSYLSPPDAEPPAPAAIDLLLLREWLAWLYDERLTAVTIRRKLAAVRGLFRFLLREGVVRGERGAPGAHAQGAEDAAGGDDARSRPTR